jgi:hypothetical protein
MTLGEVQRVIFKTADDDGTIGSFSLDVQADGGTNPIEAFDSTFIGYFNAVSAGKIVGRIGQTADNSVVGESDNSPYDIRDKLEVGYVGSQNDHHKIEIGDPSDDIWQADMEHVNPTNGLWTALVTAIEANVKDKLGHPVTVTYGKRTRSRNLRRKVNPEAE